MPFLSLTTPGEVENFNKAEDFDDILLNLVKLVAETLAMPPEVDLEGAAGCARPLLFFTITCVFAIALKN